MKKRYVLAVLEYVDEDDSMIKVKTGTINGNGKINVVELGENKCVTLTDTLKENILSHWDYLGNSPEDALFKIIRDTMDA